MTLLLMINGFFRTDHIKNNYNKPRTYRENVRQVYLALENARKLCAKKDQEFRSSKNKRE